MVKQKNLNQLLWTNCDHDFSTCKYHTSRTRWENTADKNITMILILKPIKTKIQWKYELSRTAPILCFVENKHFVSEIYYWYYAQRCFLYHTVTFYRRFMYAWLKVANFFQIVKTSKSTFKSPLIFSMIFDFKPKLRPFSEKAGE